MAVRHVEDLLAFQLAREFKLEVYRLMRSCPDAAKDFKYRCQLFDSASSVEATLAEGFRRNTPREFSQFIRYSLASLSEARIRLRDGVDRQYFSESQCAGALRIGARCHRVTSA